MNTTVTEIRFAYSDRRNGWYTYASNTQGDQIGNAEYRYQKSDVIRTARKMARDYGLTDKDVHRV